MTYRTYEEWAARGRFVQQGEKAMGFLNDGTAIFGKEQTKKRPKRVFPQDNDPDSWYMGDEYDYA